ncbi:MAG: hypothetical protein KAT00_15280, partial [Planctomycetes bacterium]|nr:hypothetical protein [Planctomycetota bacterium]
MYNTGMSKISDRLGRIKENIAAACDRASRSEKKVKLVVVTKTADIEAVREIIELGCRDLGENRLQHFKQIVTETDTFLNELESDTDAPRKVNWHMIGHLQRNKVKQVLKIASTIHSVDTLRLAEEINNVAGKLGTRPDVLMQV